MKYDIITVGGATLDVFVKTENEMRKHLNHTDLCYHMGDKILIEKIIFKTGGGGKNTAVAFSRLGLKTGFIGVLGRDEHGEIILKDLEKEKVSFLGNIRRGETGYSIILNEPKDRTILVYKGVNNNLSKHNIHIKKLDAPWFYLSTMLGQGFYTIQDIASWAQSKKSKVALNISIYLAKHGVKKLCYFLKNINVLILNKEEAAALTKIHDSRKSIVKIQKSLFAGGIAVITDSFKPIIAYDGKSLHIKKIKKINPKNTTGAGDAFGSGFVYGLIKGKSLDLCLDYGIKEAHAVLKSHGAKSGLLNRL